MIASVVLPRCFLPTNSMPSPKIPSRGVATRIIHSYCCVSGRCAFMSSPSSRALAAPS